jgi:hypothetical protein
MLPDMTISTFPPVLLAVCAAAVFFIMHISASLWFLAGGKARDRFFTLANSYLADESITDAERYLVESMLDDVTSSSFLWRAAIHFPISALFTKLEPPSYQPALQTQHKNEFDELVDSHFYAVVHTGTYAVLLMTVMATLSFLIIMLRGKMMQYSDFWRANMAVVTPHSRALRRHEESGAPVG